MLRIDSSCFFNLEKFKILSRLCEKWFFFPPYKSQLKKLNGLKNIFNFCLKLISEKFPFSLIVSAFWRTINLLHLLLPPLPPPTICLLSYNRFRCHNKNFFTAIIAISKWGSLRQRKSMRRLLTTAIVIKLLFQFNRRCFTTKLKLVTVSRRTVLAYGFLTNSDCHRIEARVEIFKSSPNSSPPTPSPPLTPKKTKVINKRRQKTGIKKWSGHSRTSQDKFSR